MNNQYYGLMLHDHATPSYCNYLKDYYGTLADITELMGALDTDKHRTMHSELINAFRAYEHRETKSTSFLEPVELLGSVKLRMEQFSWTHMNIWECPYHLRCDSVETIHLWIRRKDQFLRILKGNFENLEYLSPILGWRSLPPRFWGFPEMIVSADGHIYNRLAIYEKSFQSRTEAEADMSAFPSVKDVDFTEFCNDIFGDG